MRTVHMSSFSRYKKCAVRWSTQSPCSPGGTVALYAAQRNPVMRNILVMMNTTKCQWLLAAMQVLRNKQWWSVWWWQATHRRQWWAKGGDASWHSEQYPFTMPSPTPLSTSRRGPSARTMPGSPTEIKKLTREWDTRITYKRRDALITHRKESFNMLHRCTYSQQNRCSRLSQCRFIQVYIALIKTLIDKGGKWLLNEKKSHSQLHI